MDSAVPVRESVPPAKPRLCSCPPRANKKAEQRVQPDGEMVLYHENERGRPSRMFYVTGGVSD